MTPFYDMHTSPNTCWEELQSCMNGMFTRPFIYICIYIYVYMYIYVWKAYEGDAKDQFSIV